jgi:hypothetical protein
MNSKGLNEADAILLWRPKLRFGDVILRTFSCGCMLTWDHKTEENK